MSPHRLLLRSNSARVLSQSSDACQAVLCNTRTNPRCTNPRNTESTYVVKTIQRTRQNQALRTFSRCGLLGFGGPLVVLAMIHERLVRKHQLVSEQRYLQALAVCNLLPGPTAFQVIAFLAADLAGPIFSLLSVVVYAAPSIALLWWLATLYQEYAALPLVHEVLGWMAPAALAVVTVGGLALSQKATTTRLGKVALVASLIAVGVLKWPATLVLLCIAVAAAAIPASLLTFNIPGMALLFATAEPITHRAMVKLFLTTGVLAFGGGPVIIPLLRDQLVHQLGWLSDAQFIDALALGQANPGPVMSTVTFIGYLVGSHTGALIATMCAFGPAFIFVNIARTLFDRMPMSARLERAVSGGFSAGIGAMLAAVAFVALSVLQTPAAIAWTILCMAALLSKRVSNAQVLIGSALLPFIIHIIGGV